MSPYQKMVLRLLMAILRSNSVEGCRPGAASLIREAEALIKELES